MGHSIVKSLFDLALDIFEGCGVTVFLAWVVVRAWREIRDIIRGGTP